MYDLLPRNYWTAIREDEGRLKVIGTQPWAEARKFIDVTSGKKYRLRYNTDLGNCAYLHIIVYNPADGSYVWVPSSGGITTGGNYSGTFTAAADLLEIRFQMPALPAGESTGYFYLDNIYLEEVVEYEDGGSVNGGGYRYQFNGKELDKEVSATTTYDYGFRIYSPGLGRFLSVDPLTGSYPFYSPYQFAGNMPIWAIDIDGLEPKKYSEWGRWIPYKSWNKYSKEDRQELNVIDYGNYFGGEQYYLAVRDQKDVKKWHYITYQRVVGSFRNIQNGNWLLNKEGTNKYIPFTPEGFIPADQEIRARAKQVGGFGRYLENGIVQATIFGVTAPLGGVGSWGSRLFMNTAIEVGVNGRNADVADITMSSLPGMGGLIGVGANSLVDYTPGAEKQINRRINSILLPNSRITSHKSLKATIIDAGSGYIFEGMKLFSNKSIPGLSKPQQDFLNTTYDVSEKVINKTIKEGIEEQK